MIASSALIPPRVVSVDSSGSLTVHRRQGVENLREDQLSVGARHQLGRATMAVTFTDCIIRRCCKTTCQRGLPPLIVNVHGGPTSPAPRWLLQ